MNLVLYMGSRVQLLGVCMCVHMSVCEVLYILNDAQQTGLCGSGLSIHVIIQQLLLLPGLHLCRVHFHLIYISAKLDS